MKAFYFIVIILFALPGLSQDGKIIEQVLFTVEKSAPQAKAMLEAVNFYRITYLSDGLKVKGYMAVPKKEGKHPCIIFNRGGNEGQSLITDESFVRGLGQICSQGYVIVASQYRGNGGGEGKEEFGGKDVNDVLNLVPLLSNVPQADTSRIGMYGWSRGGMMTYLALTRTSRIKAAVVGSGVTDLMKSLETRPGMDTAVYGKLIPDYARNKTEALNARSAVYFADKINKSTPILMLQGTADWRVPANQVLTLVTKFYELKQPFRFILYEGGDHALTEHRDDFMRQIINWFHYYLRDGKRWPSIEPHGN